MLIKKKFNKISNMKDCLIEIILKEKNLMGFFIMGKNMEV